MPSFDDVLQFLTCSISVTFNAAIEVIRTIARVSTLLPLIYTVCSRMIRRVLSSASTLLKLINVERPRRAWLVRH